MTDDAPSKTFSWAPATRERLGSTSALFSMQQLTGVGLLNKPMFASFVAIAKAEQVTDTPMGEPY